MQIDDDSGGLPSDIAIAQVYNALNSFAMLHRSDLRTASEWVEQTAAMLPAQRLHTNRLLFDELSAALLLEGDWPDVSSYLDALITVPPTALRDRVLALPLTTARSSEATALLDQPSQLHDVIIEHLRYLVDQHWLSEWSRVERTLRQHVDLLRRSTPGSGLSPSTIAANLHQFVASTSQPQAGIAELIFVPSAHTGRHVTRLRAGSTLYVFFDVDLHRDVLLRDTPMKQVELVARLSALTEPNRLRVLTLLAQHRELTLQDLMDDLQTSQPNVSRYLKALGFFVQERRGKDGRKHYRLLPTELDATFDALKQQVLAAPIAAAPQVEDSMSTEGLTRYLDPQGAVLMWPRREEDRRAVLRYLADRFAPETEYSEKQVNAVLTHYVLPHVRDYATVRRDLIDSRLLMRSGDGVRYWRGDDQPAQPAARVLSDEEAYDRYWGGERNDTP